MMSRESNHGAAHGEGREDGARMPTTLAQASRKSDKSISWWRGQAGSASFRSAPSEAIPPDEMDRISRRLASGFRDVP
jgi:hypothetical protein